MSSDARTPEEFAWACGLFEGEGSVSYRQRCRLSLSSTDHDVLVRFHRAVGVGVIDGPRQIEGRKPIWTWRLYGFDACLPLMLSMQPQLGHRRREQIEEVLGRYEAQA